MISKLLPALACALLLAACSGPDSSTSSGSGSLNSGSGAGAGLNGGVGRGAPGSEEDLAANVGDRVFFAFEKAQLDDKSRATLDRQAAWLARYPANKVLIAGNCDERGTSEYNLAIGERRAHVARDYLQSKGIAPTRIRTISYGKERPTALGSDEAAWAQNRNAITSVE
jgi:peptidoglycan-associated lipoprotein